MFWGHKKIKIFLFYLKLKAEGRDVTAARRELRVQLNKQIKQWDV